MCEDSREHALEHLLVGAVRKYGTRGEMVLDELEFGGCFNLRIQPTTDGRVILELYELDEG